MGWGVFDRLKQLGVPNVFAIEFSRSPDRVNFDDPIKTANKRAEIWASMREWLKCGFQCIAATYYDLIAARLPI
jgi:hypothetical protein